MIDVKKIAELARLDIAESDIKHYEKQFVAIMEYFNSVSSIDIEGVKPLVTPTDMKQTLREDEKVIWEERSMALENAPEISGNLFKVPPVM